MWSAHSTASGQPMQEKHSIVDSNALPGFGIASGGHASAIK